MNDDEIVDAEIVEPSAIEPARTAIDHFAGPVDHIDGLMEIRDGILQAEAQAAVLLANGDIERLANATADVKVIYDDIGTFIRARRADIANYLIAQHEREGGNPRRRPKLEVEGLGIVEVPSGRERKNWRSPELLMRLIAQAIISEDGEARFSDPIDAATAIYETLLDCLPVTASLGWRVGSFDKVSETWTGLRGHGIDLDEFSDEVEKDRLADIPKRSES